MTAADRLIVALDFTDAASALRMARRLRGLVRTVKVGSALFTACGPDIVRRIRALGFRVMLDLKFHDIPSTVELSCRSAVRQRVSLLTVHARGGGPMLKAAVASVQAETRRLHFKQRPLVLAVTRLTSDPPPPVLRGGSETLGGQREIARDVKDLAYTVKDAGCDGVVASSHEANELKKIFKDKLMIVCPGIRPATAFRDDQRRVETPANAIAAGADFLVVGRPITGARDPRKAAQAMLNEMKEVVGC